MSLLNRASGSVWLFLNIPDTVTSVSTSTIYPVAALALILYITVLKRHHTYRGGGQQLTTTVISQEDLLAAQKDPEKYRDLIVRVGGYSDYFVELGRDLQNNVIKRTVEEL